MDGFRYGFQQELQDLNILVGKYSRKRIRCMSFTPSEDSEFPIDIQQIGVKGKFSSSAAAWAGCRMLLHATYLSLITASALLIWSLSTRPMGPPQNTASAWRNSQIYRVSWTKPICRLLHHWFASSGGGSKLTSHDDELMKTERQRAYKKKLVRLVVW